MSLNDCFHYSNHMPNSKKGCTDPGIWVSIGLIAVTDLCIPWLDQYVLMKIKSKCINLVGRLWGMETVWRKIRGTWIPDIFVNESLRVFLFSQQTSMGNSSIGCQNKQQTFQWSKLRSHLTLYLNTACSLSWSERVHWCFDFEQKTQNTSWYLALTLHHSHSHFCKV